MLLLLLLLLSVLLTCNSGDRCILLPSTLSPHLFEASLHRSSCYMPQMLMSDIMPALTLSAGCKCYHRSLHRHNAPIYIQLARGGNITAHERKMPCHLLNYTSPAAHTLKIILDLFGRHSVSRGFPGVFSFCTSSEKPRPCTI